MINIRITDDIRNANAVTHGGKFHADEVLATVILGKIFDEIIVCRTFEVPKQLSKDTIVYDIGLGELDHHQKNGNGRRTNGVPYAACGLVWKRFGHYIVEDSEKPGLLWSIIDKELIQGVDAIDNGDMAKLDYPTQPLNISRMISNFNPAWDSDENDDKAFVRAVLFAETVFDQILINSESKIKAQKKVEEAIENSANHIMILEKNMPWQEVFYYSDNPKADDIWFVIYPSKRGGFNWQGIYIRNDRKHLRKEAPEEWKGASEKYLRRITKVNTAMFCHPKGFVGGAKTIEDTLKLVEIIINS